MEEHLKKLIKRKFEVSFMSNAKWRKLFVALEPLQLKQAYWKFVDREDEFRDIFIDEEDLMEKFVGDCGLAGGPFAYRRIEWVEIPSIGIDPQYEKIPYMNFEQDITEAGSILKSLGEFEIENTKRGLRIYGHK